MSAQPRLELVTSQDDLLDEVVSPELVLVDPELAERARATLRLPQTPAHIVPRPVEPRLVRGDAPPGALEPRPAVLALPRPVLPAPVAVPVEPVAVSPAAQVTEQPRQAVAPPVPPAPSTGRMGKLRLLAFGITIGVFGGIIAADVWMPPGASESTVAPTVPPVTRPKAKVKPARKTPAEPKPAATEPKVPRPAFVWIAVRGVTRYEVVFERGGKVVYRAKTSLTRLELPPSWRLDGKTHRLEPGRYHWTVWPLVDGRRGRPVVSSDYTA